jgi:hypothetical protein
MGEQGTTIGQGILQSGRLHQSAVGRQRRQGMAHRIEPVAQGVLDGEMLTELLLQQ